MKKLLNTLAVFALLAVPAAAQTIGQYQSNVTAQLPTAYFKLDSSLESSVNGTHVLQSFGGGGFLGDVYGNSTNCYYFVDQTSFLRNVTDSLINGGGTTNLSSSNAGSISFLFRSLGGINTGQRYLFSAGKTTTNGNAMSVFLENTNSANGDPNSLKLRFGDSTTTVLQSSDITENTWYYFALTYDETPSTNKATWYVGRVKGTLTSGQPVTAMDAVAGEGAGFAIGNSLELDDAFRNPGEGRIDEFAIWSRQLTPSEINTQFASAGPAGVLVTNVIVNDFFADGNRTNTGPLQADWWSSSSTNGNSVEAYTNKLKMVTGTSGRGLHGTFAPQTLAVGDTITATYTFVTPTNIDINGIQQSAAFKVALMDFNDSDLAADLNSSSSSVNPVYTNLPGYLADYDVYSNSLISATADISFRKHQVPNSVGRFLGTTTGWDSFGGSGTDTGYVFEPNTEYVGVLSISRTEADAVDLYCSLSKGGVELASHGATDSSSIANNYGMLGFWANSSKFGNTTASGEFEDNGIYFTNVKVEVSGYSVVPPTPPTLDIARSGSDVILSWLTADSAGYNLVSTPSLTSPSWSSNGPPPVVVGDSYVVTNSATDTKFYRLSKP